MNLLSHNDLVNIKEPVLAKSIIYFLFYDDEVVYISSTSKGKDFGVAQHLKDKEFDSFSFIEVNEADIQKLLVEYIVKYSPKYNSYLLPHNNTFKSKEELKKLFSLGATELNRLVRKYNIDLCYQRYYRLDEIKSALKKENFYK